MPAKILIVEDHDDFRESVKKFLRMNLRGFQILETSSAEAGIALALKEHPNIILMDVRLPEMNGIDAAVRIKESFPECDIIVLTIFETEIFRDIFKNSAITEYIGKSELFQRLMPAIKRILEKKRHHEKCAKK